MICRFLITLFFAVNLSLSFAQSDSAKTIIPNLDSVAGKELEVKKIQMHMSDYEKTNVEYKTTNTAREKCTVTFLGCDNEKMSEFNAQFYKELNNVGTRKAFEIAKEYLFAKYPDCPINPILNCKQ